MRDTLVFLEYLEAGLIPVKSFDRSSIEEFEKFLNSLDEEEKRVVTRKFRKIFRSIVKTDIASSRNPEVTRDFFVKRYGYTIKKPSKYQLRDRRRFVHNWLVRKCLSKTQQRK